MNKFLLLTVLAATCSLSTHHCHADPLGPKPGELVTVDGFQVSLTASASEFVVSTPIPVKAIITNVMDKTGYVGMSSNLADYRFEVTTAKGEDVPLTRFGQRIERNKTTFFSRGPLELAPGRNDTQAFILNQMFDMTIPGEYIVKVSHWIKFPTEKGAKEATSNTLHITVTY